MKTSISILIKFSLFVFICLILNNKGTALAPSTSFNYLHQHIKNNVTVANDKVFDKLHTGNNLQLQDAEPDLDDLLDYVASVAICGILLFLLPPPIITTTSERYLLKSSYITTVPRYILFHSLIIPSTV